MNKILTIIGARPQFIKAATVSRILHPIKHVKEIIVHTGQHYDKNMSDIFFQELQIPEPQFNLGIGSGTHATQTGRMLIAIEEVLADENPDVVLVYGDTNSTLAGAIVAAKCKIPVVHVEAGLRSGNRYMPEEINRVLTDDLASRLYAPTQIAVDNLLAEGKPVEHIINVGDVMYDAALFYQDRAKAQSKIIDRLNLEKNNYCVTTVHRAENTDNIDKLRAIFSALIELSDRITIVCPLHPRTKKILIDIGLLGSVESRLCIIEPVSYFDMIVLIQNSKLILTDSGGLQKEAFFYKTPCITFREETEWIETIKAGANILVNPLTVDNVLAAYQDLIIGSRNFNNLLYGRGNAAQLIADDILGLLLK